ncbi:MAG: aspartate--tRNA ligase [Candidatus Micrarchaeota archaeon]|nr:aspartate--tRNA ligase [Candidatus Micrarchaeota archaeon]
MMRTHTCGELTEKDEGKQVALCGWNHSIRDHGGIIFGDLRDRYGVTQIVFDPSKSSNVHKMAESLRREDVICVKGVVRKRDDDTVNENIPTGRIEVVAEELSILSRSKTPPMEIDERLQVNDDIRMRYRYIDLRRPNMKEHIIFRHKAAQAVRSYLSDAGFIEIETPMLVKSTPEGARDYVVPSRVNPGKFYALPQSPQLYKQILMVSGFDRYFQLARCFRDEDLRADRQPEHTQIDIEMSFAEPDDVFNVIEGLISDMIKKVSGVEIASPFPRITYKEAMEKYCIDKPDIRYDLFITDVTEIVKKSDFSVFTSVIEKGGAVKCINPGRDFGRSELDGYIEYVKSIGGLGMAWMKVTESGLESNIVKYFSDDVQAELLSALRPKPGSVLLFIADKPKNACEYASKLRSKIAKDMQLYDEKELAFCWVTDFPLFERDEETEKLKPMHHMFSMPKKEDIPLLDTEPENVVCTQYDLVLNGVELGSGSVRIHDRKLQEKIISLIGYTKDEIDERFGFLLEAFEYGAPPHAGIAIGFDRLVALLLGFNDIREVIAFPKNKAAQCPMDGSPGRVTPKQLKELNIKIDET